MVHLEKLVRFCGEGRIRLDAYAISHWQLSRSRPGRTYSLAYHNKPNWEFETELHFSYLSEEGR
jgi:hypothetical protein